MPRDKITRNRKPAKTQLEKLASAHLDIQAESPQAARCIAYGCRWLIMATMPHRRTTERSVQRKNGNLTVQYMADVDGPGLPFGPKPRLIGTWLETEVVRTRDREIHLGDTFTEWVRALGFDKYHGGKVYKSIRDQAIRLFSSTVKVSRRTRSSLEFDRFQIASKARLWWSPDSPDQTSLLGPSRILVGEDYAKEILAHPVPFDLRALRALRGSSLSLDIYRWYAARLPTVPSNDPVFIPWREIQNQLGCDYKTDKHGRYEFQRTYIKHHKKVQLVYPEARVEFERGGVVLYESAPPVPRKRFPRR